MDAERLADAIAAGHLPREPYVAALPMYDWPERRHEVDAEWGELRDALRARGINAPESLTRRNADLPGYSGDLPDELDLPTLWQHPNLLLAQTCHGPLELWLRGVRVVGQEDYSGIEGGEGELYSSAIVMREKARPDAALLDLLKGKRLAYNAPDSLSGYLALERDLEAQSSGLKIFSALIETGGHRKSIRAVAEGRADVAAIDCRSWMLAQRYEVAAKGLEAVWWTGKRQGLPFVTYLPSA
jgi:ABC-type phosphate/phosphonate transport system substrate-binding protein